MDSFEQQVLEALPGLRRYARSLCRDASEAEDLVQDCLEKAFASRANWRGGSIQAWLMTILSNVYKNARRSTARRPATVPIEEMPDLSADHSEADPLEAGRLKAAVDRLDADQRMVLMLVAVEGYRYGEVARLLDVPAGTVMSRLFRARRNVAASLKGENILEFRRHR